MSKYRHIEDEGVRESLDEYKDTIDKNPKTLTLGEIILIALRNYDAHI